MTEHIVAVFGSNTAADLAVQDLERHGIPTSAIRRYTPESTQSEHHGGFWSWILGEEDGIEAQRARYPNDHELYDRRIKAGNVVVNVTLSDPAMAESAMTIMADHQPLELDESNDSPQLAAEPATPASTAAEPIHTDPLATSPTPSSLNPQTTEEVIPLSQEQVNIGKRMEDKGVTRVRRYVTETPVERDVTLQGERVTVERRRPVDVTNAAPGTAFEERTVEVHEKQEVPVVEKTARVVEEVAIKKEATEQTATVRDTERRDEVEVEGKPVTNPVQQ